MTDAHLTAAQLALLASARAEEPVYRAAVRRLHLVLAQLQARSVARPGVADGQGGTTPADDGSASP